MHIIKPRILFFLKTTKRRDAVGAYFIYLRITVNGARAELATGKTCARNDWNSKIGQLIGQDGESLRVNLYLNKIKADLNAHIYQLQIHNQEISADILKNKLVAKPEELHTLFGALAIHNEKMKALVEKGGYARGTFKRFEVLGRFLKEYIQGAYASDDIVVDKIDFQFIEGFDFFLRTVKDNGNNTAIKHIKNFGKIIRLCLHWKWIASDPMKGYRMRSAPVSRDYLTPIELGKVARVDCGSERLDRARDFFLFSCYTGLSYVDVQALKYSDIRQGVDGELWIFTDRKKTQARVAVPLLLPAANIIAKYREHPLCVAKGKALPMPSNQKMNKTLIEVAKLAGVGKILGNRVAKRTFGTTVTLSNGVPIESVSKMLGHTNIKTTMLYAEILDDKVAKDMASIRSLFES